MTQENQDKQQAGESLFIKEVETQHAVYMRILEIVHSSTKAAGFMLLAAIVALIVANSGIYAIFYEFWHMEAGFFVGDYVAEMSLAHMVNDIFMAVFFLLVGLEIKYEMTVGELTNIRQALLPIVAAAGGVLCPIVIYSIFNASNPSTSNGWGVPTATDIAFALGIMALLGNRVPNGIRVFLSTLAVADDIIAILVIAIFYGESPSMVWLMFAAGVFVALIIMNRRHIYSIAPYAALGVLLWYCVYMSGVHSTIAGVLLAFTIPSGSRINLKSFTSWSGKRLSEAHELYAAEDPVIAQKDYMYTVARISKAAREVVPPAMRLENMLYPWVYFGVLPLFALTNADVSLVGSSLGNVLADPAFLGVFFGLLLGKPIGIILFSVIVIKTRMASLPEHTNWGHMVGAGILGGVGFTMAIFVANLAYADASIVTTAKLAILCAWFASGIFGFVVLYVQAAAAR